MFIGLKAPFAKDTDVSVTLVFEKAGSIDAWNSWSHQWARRFPATKCEDYIKELDHFSGGNLTGPDDVAVRRSEAKVSNLVMSTRLERISQL